MDDEKFIEVSTLKEIFSQLGANEIDFLDYHCWKMAIPNSGHFASTAEGLELLRKAKSHSLENKWKGVILAIYERNVKRNQKIWSLTDKDGIKRILLYGNPYLFSRVVMAGCENGQFIGQNLIAVLSQGLKYGLVKKDLIANLTNKGYLNVN
jgi:hypothetical protein